MRKPVIENIEIIDPPIGELSRQQGSFKKTCLTGCGCVIFLIIGLLGALRFFVGSGPTSISKLPNNFPVSVPIYEKDSIENMTFISGVYKNRSIEIAAFFPKVILSPMLMQLRHDDTATSSGFIAANRNFWQVLTTPVGDSSDTVIVQWKDIEADPGFVIAYYQKELHKSNYELTEVKQENNSLFFSFEGENGISGSLMAETELNEQGTKYAALTVNIPAWYRNPPAER